MNSHSTYIAAFTLLVSMGLAGCASRQPADELRNHQADPSLRVDLTPRRMTGRQQVKLSSHRVLYADRVRKQTDGAVIAEGRVYVSCGEQPEGPQPPIQPRHMYAEHAQWIAATQTLELGGWPILESSGGRIVGTSAETAVVLSGETLKIKGQTSTILVGGHP